MTAPKLTLGRLLTTAVPLRASPNGSVAVLSTRVRVDKRAAITLTVRSFRTGKKLTLQAGSRLGDTTLTKRAVTAKTGIGAARTFTFKILLSRRQVSRGARFEIALTATGPTGKTSTLKIGALG